MVKAGDLAAMAQEQRRALKLVAGMADHLLQSVWAQVDMAHEDAVCDFLADLLCSDPEFVNELETFGLWLETSLSAASLSSDESAGTDRSTALASPAAVMSRRAAEASDDGDSGRLQQLWLNLHSALTTKLPKRSGGSMIHVAAADGGYVVLNGVIGLLKRAMPCRRWREILDSR